MAARTFASSGLSTSDLLPVGSSSYLSASFDARVTHESAEDSVDCAEVMSWRASLVLTRALSARACARSSFGQKSASASPHIPYDSSSFFEFFGTPENSSVKTVADLPAHSARVDSSAMPFTRRKCLGDVIGEVVQGLDERAHPLRIPGGGSRFLEYLFGCDHLTVKGGRIEMISVTSSGRQACHRRAAEKKVDDTPGRYLEENMGSPRRAAHWPPPALWRCWTAESPFGLHECRPGGDSLDFP
ncbi:hypothetical protein GCM10010095_25490 [Streptomyces anthocyanicus]|uniref:hypothetical protein n=1 Tax=Streptomyces anthocyanicus TaxID=68174 RepID=UPI00166FEBDC|nr:hypothetical protein [Streptomyces anthocyanicus]GGL39331.1 hypothetical protein GCM10010095_25490 [Streptomyces anthocyanicus]